MIDQKKLSSFWDKNVPTEFKHFIGSPFDKKLENYINDIKDHLINRIDFTNIELALDWGCGGGLGSRFLSEHCGVVALDIAESSLRQCGQYLKKHSKELVAGYKLEDIEKLVIKEKIDLLYSASVVQHFPSYEYWKRVASFWKTLQPRFIAIQTRHGDQNKCNEAEYFDKTENYILGLYLTTNEVIDCFIAEYSLRYHKLIDDNHSMYEYFVFKRK